MHFPYFVFNPNNRMTFADRTSKLCEYYLKKSLKSLQVTCPTARADYVYRTLISSDSIDAGILSIASLIHASSTMPSIQLFADESLSPIDVKERFASHGMHVEVYSPKDLFNLLETRNEKLLNRFATAFFWGRKTALSFGLGNSKPVLYCDLDVLWFQDPRVSLSLDNLKGIIAGTDSHYSYDPEILYLASGEDRRLLERSPPVCAGVYAVGKNYELSHTILNYIDRQLAQGAPGYFCEQTLLALAVKLDGTQLEFSQLPTCPKEKTIFQPSYKDKRWIAAHYAGPTRPQFWRDAYSHCRLGR